jgi:drug/metabolite transporter (DMT)-like permease
MPNPTRNIPLGFTLGFLGVVIFGGTLPATVLALPSFGPLFIAGSRASAAAVLAAIVLVALRRRLARSDLGAVFVAGLMVTFGFPAFSSLAMQTVDASHGGVVLGILPLATAGWDFWIDRGGTFTDIVGATRTGAHPQAAVGKPGSLSRRRGPGHPRPAGRRQG